MTTRKSGKSKQKLFALLYLFLVSAVFCLLVLIFLLSQNTQSTLYVFPENPKQGDTVFIRVKTSSSTVAGNSGDGKLIFFKKINSTEWIAFLGIDADRAPGSYTVSVATSKTEQLTNFITVEMADFSKAKAVQAPSISQKGFTVKKAEDNIEKNDNPVLKKYLSNFTPVPYFSRPFSFPLKNMENTGLAFGRFINFAKYQLQHLGIDLRAPKKTDIYAVNDGKVVATLNLSNYGKTVIIDHGLDIFSLYLHLEEFKATEGEMVKRGQVIGLSGDTGYSTAPHLHFSMRVGDSRIDPVAFIKVTQKMDDNFFIADIKSAFLNFLGR